MTFFAGASEPVWLMAEIAQLAGNVPKAARRLGVRVSKLHTGDNYVQANARRIGFERETAIEAGFAPPEPVEIFPSLVFAGGFTHPRACSTNDVVAGFAAIHRSLLDAFLSSMGTW
jgi:hypothetical protein